MLTAQQKLEILCAYLPHGVECFVATRVQPDYRTTLTPSYLGDISGVRPILRHPDDMTEEEFKKLANLIGYDNIKYAKWWLKGDPYDITIEQAKSAFRYLHSIHVDTFGAIDAGWAIRKEVSNG